jgi:hypothetical protein
MSATATSIGPIGARQINRNLYVGQSDLTTIQRAVTWAANQGGVWTVVIPAAYQGSDTIAAVSGGTASIGILDLRNLSWQTYVWNVNVYVPSVFALLGNLSVAGQAFFGQDVSIAGTAHIAGDAAIVGDITAQDAEFATCEVNGSPVLTVATGRPMVYPPIGIGVSTGTAWGASIDPVDVPRISTANTFVQTQSVNGQVRAYGWNLVDLTRSHAKIGTSNSLITPLLTLINASAPVNQRIWTMAAATGDLHFSMAEDGGTDHYWLQVLRSTTSAPQIGFFFPLWLGHDADALTPKGLMITPDNANNAINFQGETQGSPTTYDQAINLNMQGGLVNIGPDGLAVEGGVVAEDAEFATCEVAGSPVRTFANSGGGGISFPPAGIPVSTGSAWLASINPASLVPYPAAGIAVSTGSAWGTPINPASLVPYPAAGIAVSTGNAWGTPINPSSLVQYPPAGAAVSTGSAWSTPIPMTDNGSITTLTHALQIPGGPGAPTALISGATATTDGRMSFVPPTAVNQPSYFSIYSQYFDMNYVFSNITGNVPGKSTVFGGNWGGFGVYTYIAINANANPVFAVNTRDQIQGRFGVGNNMFSVCADTSVNTFHHQLDSPTGAMILHGLVNFNYNVNQAAIVTPSLGLTLAWNVYFGTGETDYINSKGSAEGGHYFFNVAPGTNVTSTTPWSMALDSTDTLHVKGSIFSPQFQLSSGGSFWTTDGNAAYFNAGSNGILFINANTGPTSSCIITGELDVTGTKNFLIPHPLDKAKDLVHSSLEGPECGVFYRGEVTTKKGVAEVTLPDYFEKLTLPGDRTVLLTQVFESTTDELVMLAASRVTAGKFKIRSSTPSVKVAWEVKAVRSDVPRLEVARAKLARPKKQEAA